MRVVKGTFGGGTVSFTCTIKYLIIDSPFSFIIFISITAFPQIVPELYQKSIDCSIPSSVQLVCAEFK